MQAVLLITSNDGGASGYLPLSDLASRWRCAHVRRKDFRVRQGMAPEFRILQEFCSQIG